MSGVVPVNKQWLAVGGVLAVLAVIAVVAMRGSSELFPVGVGTSAPGFKAVDVVTGDTVTLDRYRGQVVVLNVWATWCEPCRVEMPAMERLAAELGPRGLKVVAVSVDVGERSGVSEYRRDYGLTFDVLQDRTRAIERAYQTSAVPESFIVNRHGVIVKKIIGPYDWDSAAAEGLVKRLLAEPA